jgi:mono/diheme cytochrome c family protein
MDPSGFPIAASPSAETFFFILAGTLVALALATAGIGLWREDFPSAGALRGLLGLIALLVLATGAGAVLSARDEQESRRAENAQAAKEADAETVEKQQEEAPLTEGEAAQPDTATGEASSPDEGGLDGKSLFVDTGCGACHTLADADTSGQIGPVLDDVLPGQDPDAIRTSIIDPGSSTSDGFPEGVMPTIYGDQLTAVEIDALVTYLGDVAGKN